MSHKAGPLMTFSPPRLFVHFYERVKAETEASFTWVMRFLQVLADWQIWTDVCCVSVEARGRRNAYGESIRNRHMFVKDWLMVDEEEIYMNIDFNDDGGAWNEQMAILWQVGFSFQVWNYRNITQNVKLAARICSFIFNWLFQEKRTLKALYNKITQSKIEYTLY